MIGSVGQTKRTRWDYNNFTHMNARKIKIKLKNRALLLG